MTFWNIKDKAIEVKITRPFFKGKEESFESAVEEELLSVKNSTLESIKEAMEESNLLLLKAILAWGVFKPVKSHMTNVLFLQLQ